MRELFGKFGFLVIDVIRGTSVVKVFTELLKFQFLDKSKLNKLSQTSLDELVKKSQNIPFYKSYASFDEYPILTKKIVREKYDSFFNPFISKKERVRKKTGGSTGEPFVYYTGKESQSYLWAGILLAWNAAGWIWGEKVVFLAGSSIFGKGWKLKIYYALMNVKVFDSFDMNQKLMKACLSYIEKHNVQFLYGYAFSLYELAKFNENNAKQVSVKSVISTAENLTESMRKKIENSFSCEVFNQYGCNDGGVSAFECEVHDGFHYISTRAYVESIDGRLVSTDMKNEVMPLLRYDTGDRVVLSDRLCACGRGFPIIQEISGRSNDVVFNTETNAMVHSEFFNHLFRENQSISSYQVVIEDRNVRINLVTEESIDLEAIRIKYGNAIRGKIGAYNITFLSNHILEHLKNGKHQTIVNKNI
ncbi:phenylacetate--CoA ligase family protein [Aureibacter tunicatorum]|uniref:Phenylacetate-CoA ligase n=1 Tax=Aureibacter tunicatorum TaxID=866807 RepID=A0AAE3XQD8_9BACT|nr:hypothetical protein [Aureibacter tunicatorum]MDR6240158.1 phenylacetate-CoA ligase [Aureibacter tunicatorum]BDD05961.1 capsular polysaccharide biosynthesis protein [Aureibacter tunicatorum]